MPLRVLIVEDEAWLLRTMALSLRAAGIDAVVAADFHEFAAHLNDIDMFDTVVMDVGMPVGTPDGVTMANAIWQREPGFPIIFATAMELSEMASDPRCTVLHKPVAPDTLVETVRSMAARKGDAPPATAEE